MSDSKMQLNLNDEEMEAYVKNQREFMEERTKQHQKLFDQYAETESTSLAEMYLGNRKKGQE